MLNEKLANKNIPVKWFWILSSSSLQRLSSVSIAKKVYDRERASKKRKWEKKKFSMRRKWKVVILIKMAQSNIKQPEKSIQIKQKMWKKKLEIFSLIVDLN